MYEDINNYVQPSSVLMTDWAVDGKSIGNLDAVIYELMLLSLLYDSVLIQDEIFALSPKFANMFSSKENIDILKKLLDIGAITVLTHPLQVYPTDELKELATAAPIFARAKYTQQYSTRADKLFKPSNKQITLYHEIDACLSRNPGTQRPVGSLMQFDIMKAFGFLLKDTLSSKHYKKWIGSAFGGITNEMADDFINFIEDTEKLSSQLTRNNKGIRLVPGPDGKPVFNRSLGYLATTLYPHRQAKAMQSLIQTTFAAPFCWRENASGRFSKFLRELLWMPEDIINDGYDQLGEGSIVSVEAHTDIEILLPEMNTDFVDHIQAIRDSLPGKKLRMVVRHMEQDISFNRQVESWYEVADLLASLITTGKPVTIREYLLGVGNGLVCGAVAHGLLTQVRSTKIDMAGNLLEGLLSGGLGILSGSLYRIFRDNRKNQKLRKKIENAVEFRCSPFNMPLLQTPIHGIE